MSFLDVAGVKPSGLDAATAALLNDPASATRGAGNATFVPRWKAATVYATGDKTVSPNGDTVTANTPHTSAAAFATDTAKWDLSTSYTTPAQAAGLSAALSIVFGG